MSVFDVYSKAEIENMPLDIYQGLSYIDQLRIRQEYPETSDRLLAESRAAQDDAVKSRNYRIQTMEHTPLNRLQPSKKRSQKAEQGTRKAYRPLTQLHLDELDTEAIEALTPQDFDRMSYRDQLQIYQKHPKVYERITAQERAEREAERKKWFEKYG